VVYCNKEWVDLPTSPGVSGYGGFPERARPHVKLSTRSASEAEAKLILTTTPRDCGTLDCPTARLNSLAEALLYHEITRIGSLS